MKYLFLLILVPSVCYGCKCLVFVKYMHSLVAIERDIAEENIEKDRERYVYWQGQCDAYNDLIGNMENITFD